MSNTIFSIIDCDPSCLTCVGGTSTDCTSCSSGLYLNLPPVGSCSISCPSGYWQDGTNNKCQACWNSATSPYTCATCVGPNSNECGTCIAGNFFYQGECLDSCPDGYWADASANQCQPCHNSGTNPLSCMTCTTGSSSSCLSCYPGSFLHLGECLDACPILFYGDLATWTCQPCYNPSGSPVQAACASCFGPLATSCLSCYTSTYYFSIDRSCLTTCPPGYFANGLSNPDNRCAPCYTNNPPSYPDGTCVTCTGPLSNQCTSCNSSQFLDTNGKCVNDCGTGWWGDTTSNTCQQCDPSCYTCARGTAFDCLSCTGSTYLNPRYRSCVSSCPIGWWTEYPTNTCRQCYLYISTAPELDSCATCSGGSSTDCSLCPSSSFLDSTTGSCVFQCPYGYWGDSTTGTCKNCYSTSDPLTDINRSCKTCTGVSNNQCLSCYLGEYYFSGNGTCLRSCPSDWYPDASTSTCNACFQAAALSTQYSCATCSGPAATDCLSCSGPAYLYPGNNSCMNPCPSGFYHDIATTTCIACTSPCLACNGPLASDCTMCSTGKLLYQNTCIGNCPSGYYPNSSDNTCRACYRPTDNEVERSCETCDGLLRTNCLSCSNELYFYSKNRTCLLNCPDGTYKETSTGTCASCYTQSSAQNTDYFSCLTCSGPLYSECLSCEAPHVYFKNDSTCRSSCPCDGGYFFDSSTNECGVCSPDCFSCSGPHQKDCVYNDEVNLECKLGEFDGKRATEIMGSIIEASSFITITVSVFTSVTSGAITMGAPTVLSTLGVIGLYQFLNVDYPHHVVLFFQYLFSNNAKLFPNFFVLFSEPSLKLIYHDSIIQGANKFNFFRVSNLFLQNFGGWLSLEMCLLILVPVAILASLAGNHFRINENARSILDGFKVFFAWNILIMTALSFFVPLILSVSLQFYYGSATNTSFEVLSLALGVILLVISGVLLTLLFRYAQVKNVNHGSRSELFASTRVLSNPDRIVESATPAKPDSHCRYWALALCLRNLVLVPLIATLSDSPVSQCLVSFLTNLSFFVITLSRNFFDIRFKRYTTRGIEFLNAVIPGLFMVYGINSSVDDKTAFLTDNSKNAIGWLIIVLISLSYILVLVFQTCESWFILGHVFRTFWKRLQILYNYVTGEDIRAKVRSLNAKKGGFEVKSNNSEQDPEEKSELRALRSELNVIIEGSIATDGIRSDSKTLIKAKNEVKNPYKISQSSGAVDMVKIVKEKRLKALDKTNKYLNVRKEPALSQAVSPSLIKSSDNSMAFLESSMVIENK